MLIFFCDKININYLPSNEKETRFGGMKKIIFGEILCRRYKLCVGKTSRNLLEFSFFQIGTVHLYLCLTVFKDVCDSGLKIYCTQMNDGRPPGQVSPVEVLWVGGEDDPVRGVACPFHQDCHVSQLARPLQAVQVTVSRDKCALTYTGFTNVKQM